MIEQWRNALVVAAHPDDEVLGCGGTIPLIKRNGGRVSVVVVTDGSSSQHADDAGAFDRKTEQMHAAAGLLGVDRLEHWKFPDMRLDQVAHVELNRALEALIAEESFDTVFVHHCGDVNLDHRAIFDSVQVATRPTPGQTVNTVLAYYTASSTEWGGDGGTRPFVPNVHVDISDTVEIKKAALAAYHDEVRHYPHPRSVDGVDALARAYGMTVGAAFAEPFALLRQTVRAQRA